MAGGVATAHVEAKIRIEDILNRMEQYRHDLDEDLLRHAYVFAANRHQGQIRRSGEPYLTHPLTVAWILADMELDEETVAAGLLHDLLEDTETKGEEIEVEFGPVAEQAGRGRVVQTAIRIPIDSLTMVPVGGDLYQGQLEFSFYLEDEKGASTPIQKSELPLELPGEAVSATTPVHITYDVGFKVRPGDHRLALNVTDALNSTASTLTWHMSIDAGGNVVVADR